MSSSRANDPWAVYDYEAQMIEGLAVWLNQTEMGKLSWAVRNALVESAALHTRVFCELLLSRGTRPDDIRLDTLLPGIDSLLIANLDTAYGNQKIEGTPCWQFNKLLAHATLKRATSHNYADALNAVWPLMEIVMQAVAAKRPTAQPSPLPKPAIP